MPASSSTAVPIGRRRNGRAKLDQEEGHAAGDGQGQQIRARAEVIRCRRLDRQRRKLHGRDWDPRSTPVMKPSAEPSIEGGPAADQQGDQHAPERDQQGGRRGRSTESRKQARRRNPGRRRGVSRRSRLATWPHMIRPWTLGDRRTGRAPSSSCRLMNRSRPGNDRAAAPTGSETYARLRIYAACRRRSRQ